MCVSCVLKPCRAEAYEKRVLRQVLRVRHQSGYFTYSPLDDASMYTWVSDTALHLEALVNGRSPLFAAVTACNRDAVKLLLRAGAHPLRCCFANPAEAYGTSSSSSSSASASASTGSKKKKGKKKAAAAAAQQQDDAAASAAAAATAATPPPAPRWTTPLHEAARRGDVAMLQLLISECQHKLPAAATRAFVDVVLPTGHEGYEKGDVHHRLQKLPVRLRDGDGQTPLSVALSCKDAAQAAKAAQAALVLLDVEAGAWLQQPIKDLQDKEGQGVTNALLVAAKVGCSRCRGRVLVAAGGIHAVCRCTTHCLHTLLARRLLVPSCTCKGAASINRNVTPCSLRFELTCPRLRFVCVHCAPAATLDHIHIQAAAVDSTVAQQLEPFISKALSSFAGSGNTSTSSSTQASAASPLTPQLARAQLDHVLNMFDERMPLADLQWFASWLVKQPTVVAAFTAATFKELRTLLAAAAKDPVFCHLLLAPEVQQIYRTRDDGSSGCEVYSWALELFLKQDGGQALELLLQYVDFEPGSARFSGNNIVHRGAIRTVAAHLPKLLEIGLPPTCRVSNCVEFVVLSATCQRRTRVVAC